MTDDVPHASPGPLRVARMAEHQRNAQSGVVQGAFGAGQREPVVGGEQHQRLLAEAQRIEFRQDAPDAFVHVFHGALQFGDLLAGTDVVHQVGWNGVAQGDVRFHAVGKETHHPRTVPFGGHPVRLREADLQVEGPVAAGHATQGVSGAIHDDVPGTSRTGVVETEPAGHNVVRQNTRFVVHADELGLVADGLQSVGDVVCRFFEIPAEGLVRQPEDTVGLGIGAREE